MDTVETKNFIESGQAILGIEFGSTRIKAVSYTHLDVYKRQV